MKKKKFKYKNFIQMTKKYTSVFLSYYVDSLTNFSFIWEEHMSIMFQQTATLLFHFYAHIYIHFPNCERFQILLFKLVAIKNILDNSFAKIQFCIHLKNIYYCIKQLQYYDKRILQTTILFKIDIAAIWIKLMEQYTIN